MLLWCSREDEHTPYPKTAEIKRQNRTVSDGAAIEHMRTHKEIKCRILKITRTNIRNIKIETG